MVSIRRSLSDILRDDCGLRGDVPGANVAVGLLGLARVGNVRTCGSDVPEAGRC
jgi:hypothetical protein